jgi:hypothetical protein
MTEKKNFENPEPAVHHALALWAADCAEHVLRLFESNCPGDDRPRLAIAAVREWTRGERTMVSCREAAFASHAAARDAKDPAAVAAARAAGQACAVAHMYTHCSHAGEYAAKAVMLAAPAETAKDAWAQEREWQHTQLRQDLWPIGFPKGE